VRPRTVPELRAAIRDEERTRDQHLADVANLHARARTEPSEGLTERIGRVIGMVRAADDRILELEDELTLARREELRDGVLGRDHTPDAERDNGDGERRVRAAGFERSDDGYRRDTSPRRPVDSSPAGTARAAALRAIERLELDDGAGRRLEQLIARDGSGLDSRYIAAVSDPAYGAAFWRAISDQAAAVSMTPAERSAWAAVQEISAQRAMSVGTGSAGGFAVPAELDPTIVNTSDGDLNPLRRLATVTTIVSNEWRGVTSEGVEAHFRAEGAEADDDTPTLAQPTIFPERADCFVPFSIELGQDWVGIRTELARLIADAKDVLEATKYLFGAGHGSHEPEGLIAGLDVGSLVPSTGANALAADDVYALQEALPPRFQPRASWLSNLAVANTVHRFSGPAGEEPALFNEDRTRLLGKPWSEVPGLADVDADAKVLVYGDLRAGFRIVDRVGLSIEVVGHLFGASRRPTGQRGLLAFWRTSRGVLFDNGVWVLQIPST
jgi:HK97 family phage major capsid protein